MKDDKEIGINARIIRVKTLNFTQNDVSILSTEDKLKLEFDTTLHFSYNQEKNEFLVYVEVVSSVKNIEFEFSKIKVENVFELNAVGVELNLEDINDKGVNLPDFVINNLVELSISNVRGILTEKFKGTIFQDEIIPLISFNNFEAS